MSDPLTEVTKKIGKANQQLDANLEMRNEAEAALAEAEAVVERRKEALATLLQDEGALRGTIGDLKTMMDACAAVPLDGDDR
jgi:chromosome segregation ATPase